MSAFDPTKPFKTRDGRSVELKITDGRGKSKFWGYAGNNNWLSGWYNDGRYFKSRESDIDLVNVEPWKLPAPPEGMQWHRDDWTEDMLPGIKRPLLIGETGTYEILLNGVWEEGTGLNMPTPHNCPFMRTDRPLPSIPKRVPLTFEYVAGFVGVELKEGDTCIYSVSHFTKTGVTIAATSISWERLQVSKWQWRSFQSPEWQPCEMEVKV